MSSPQIWLCLFTFRPIASKLFNGLTTIDTLKWLSGAVVYASALGVKDPGFNPLLRQGFLCLFFVWFLLCFFLFWKKNTVFVTKVCNSFCNFNLFSILKILQDLWPIKIQTLSPKHWLEPESIMLMLILLLSPVLFLLHSHTCIWTRSKRLNHCVQCVMTYRHSLSRVLNMNSISMKYNVSLVVYKITTFLLIQRNKLNTHLHIGR